MTFPYHKASVFLHCTDNADTEPVNFEILDSDEFIISRDDTPACTINPDDLCEIRGFEVILSIESAMMLRDFLIFCMPTTKEI